MKKDTLLPQTEIVESVGVQKSTFNQELKRNTGKRGNYYKNAQGMEKEGKN
jgi:IS30 family transposase